VSDEDWPGNVKNAADTVVTNYDLGIMLTAHENGESAVPLYPCDTILDTRNVLSGENVTRL